jgi:hypothetical protein
MISKAVGKQTLRDIIDINNAAIGELEGRIANCRERLKVADTIRERELLKAWIMFMKKEIREYNKENKQALQQIMASEGQLFTGYSTRKIIGCGRKRR